MLGRTLVTANERTKNSLLHAAVPTRYVHNTVFSQGNWRSRTEKEEDDGLDDVQVNAYIEEEDLDQVETIFGPSFWTGSVRTHDLFGGHEHTLELACGWQPLPVSLLICFYTISRAKFVLCLLTVLVTVTFCCVFLR